MCVCLSVRLSPKLKFFHSVHAECSRMFQNACKKFQNVTHASPFGIPSKKKCPAEFLNFIWLNSGQVLGKDMSEVWGVGAF